MSEQDRRPEAEIIPPGAPDPVRWRDPRRGDDGAGRRYGRVWAWSSDPRYAQLRRGSGGPLGVILVLGALAAFGAIGFLLFLGALALALPIIAAVVLVGIVGGILRRLS